MRLTFLCLVSCLLAVACGPRFISRIDLSRQYEWKPAQFTRNAELDAFYAEGTVSIINNGDRHKVDYEMFRAATALWRIDIFGFFHTHGATVIIDGMNAHIFHDGAWDEPRPWPEISLNLFGLVLPYKVLSVMVGGRFDFAGECADTIEGTVCRENNLYYFLRRGALVEIKDERISIIYSEDRWRGQSDAAPEPFYLWPGKIEKRADLPATLFRTTQEKDIFDEI